MYVQLRCCCKRLHFYTDLTCSNHVLSYQSNLNCHRFIALSPNWNMLILNYSFIYIYKKHFASVLLCLVFFLNVINTVLLHCHLTQMIINFRLFINKKHISWYHNMLLLLHGVFFIIFPSTLSVPAIIILHLYWMAFETWWCLIL